MSNKGWSWLMLHSPEVRCGRDRQRAPWFDKLAIAGSAVFGKPCMLIHGSPLATQKLNRSWGRRFV
eukprot:6412994-Amphidinium_carterae.1